MQIFFPLDRECLACVRASVPLVLCVCVCVCRCVCVCVCNEKDIGSDQKDVEWSDVVCLCNN